MSTIELTEPEAGILFSALLSFSDDEVSDEEGIVMRKYYRYTTAENLQTKMEKAGYAYPDDMAKLENDVLKALKAADKVFKLRTLAIGIELAKADGTYDQREMAVLQKYADELGVSLGEAGDFGRKYLIEIDENETYITDTDPDTACDSISLTINEAAIALCTLVAFSDDDPSDAEAGVLREYFTEEDAASVQKKFTDTGRTYPKDIISVKDDILAAFNAVDRSDKVKYLAIAYKTASADGNVDAGELEIIKDFCEELYIGLSELIEYFKPSL